ncbi:hypothetical protein FJV41_00065 [Myxococcus llanfairpwllgwyngyllgogerychwyrndrobwllllantysiliogogogochensis]|uniref:Uncharacterized protein n=1 Tax=Myxococcus llanfairpwllgwyngyllgogerychwyrndrobwllllantysiliogogogochensis TaxID=2590453 RepID=A0A540X9W6_9BACT|nr:hypothetical protein [Myxococcus llanfairpwllgwyngyllgogerychwyrndrobwllllantysiliogogogochensis]TQF17979.1 hypothetical protein FJV41_00065 [Myxococcus llanfairpwllgwyngyllgogerychwyrndrobwllllantysiliogogogochensis]
MSAIPSSNGMNPNAAAAAAEAERQRQAAEAARRAEEARRAAELAKAAAAAAADAKVPTARNRPEFAGARDEFVPQANARPLVNLSGAEAPPAAPPAGPAMAKAELPPPPAAPAPPPGATQAQAVADAFTKGGAEAAAAELRKQTENAPPDVAAEVLRAAQPTVDKITEELGKQAKKLDGGQFDSSLIAEPQKKYDQVVTDLAAATNIAVKDGKNQDVLQAVGASITRNIDQKDIGRFDEALGNAVTHGAGANLSLEVSRQLTETGRGKQADDILENVKEGTKAFNDHMKDVAKKVEDHNGKLAELIHAWGPLMTKDELTNAITEYKKGFSEYDELEKLGGQMVRTAQSLKEMPENLKGMDHADDIIKANEKLVAEQFPRIEQSGDAQQELQALFKREGTGGNTILKDVPAIAKTTDNEKEFLTQFATTSLNVVAAQTMTGAGGSEPNAFNEMLEGVRRNAALFGLQPEQLNDVIAKIQNVKTEAAAYPVPDPASGGSFSVNLPPGLNTALESLRGAIDGLSGMGLFAFNDPLSKAFQSMGGVVAAWGVGTTVPKAFDNPSVTNVLTAINTTLGAALQVEALAGLFRATPQSGAAIGSRWAAGKFLGAVGAGITLAQGVMAAKDGDLAKAGIYAAQTAGQMALVATGFVGVSASLALTGVGIVLAVGAAWGFRQLDKVRASNKHENEHTEDFLKGGGVTQDGVAHHLRNADEDGRSVGPVLTALARHIGVDPTAMLDYVQGLPKDKVLALVEACHEVDANKEGVFPAKSPKDESLKPDSLGPAPILQSPNSLNGLVLWAQLRGYELPAPRQA